MNHLPGLPTKLLIFAVIAAVLGWALTGVVLRLAERGGLVAQPTARGLHVRPTPVGGGIGFVLATAILAALWPVQIVAPWQIAIGGALVGLLAVSAVDDQRPLPVAVRLIAQTSAVVAVLVAMPHEFRIVPWLSVEFERIVAGVLWVWLINAVNFMDGSDGFAGVEGVAVSVGYAVVSAHLEQPVSTFFPGLDVIAVLLAGALMGFLGWNWSPARIFMGDVGSIPLGFLFGVFALDLALRGAWPAALILPLYFVVDATLTLLRRIARRDRFWEAHREHAYQRAILAGETHDGVAIRLAVLGVALGALAVVSLTRPYFALVCAAALTLMLFGLFSVIGARARRA